MTAVDDLWYLGDVARQRAEQTRHDLATDHEDYLEFTTTRRVSRDRFRTVARRTSENGLPYGAHTITYRPSGDLLLVRHDAVDMWVLPGGEVEGDESFREAARRELREEAGLVAAPPEDEDRTAEADAAVEGLGLLGRVEFVCDDHRTWGVLPIYAVRARSTSLSVADPDGEISDARWFDDLPEDARDREQLRRWRRERLGE